MVLEIFALRLLSAEGSGFDLSSFKVVMLEENIAGGEEADVLLEKVFLEKGKVLLLLPPPFVSDGCRVKC